MNDNNLNFNKNKIKIFIDADDTLLNSSEIVINILNKKYNLNKNINDLKDWEYKSIYKYLTRKEIIDIFNSKEFFNEVKLQEGFVKFIDLFNSDINVIIVTKGFKENLIHKKSFFEFNLPQAEFIGLPLEGDNTFNKSDIDMSEGIQIDDRTDCLQTNAIIKILYRNKIGIDYNKTPKNEENFYVTSCWSEIIEIVGFALCQPAFMENCK